MLGHLWGARVVLHPTTLILVVVLAFLLVSGDREETTGSSIARGLLLAGLLIASVLIHEMGHALAARAFRREVKEIVITLVGGHTVFDASRMTPAVSGVTALAGPVANAFLGLAALAALGLDLSPGLHMVVRAVAVVNIVLAAFNALPGTPLDGGRVLEAIVWGVTGKRTTGMKAAAWGGRVVAGGYLVYVLVSNFGAGRSPELFDLVWAFLIFSILWPAAGMSLRAARVLEKLEGLSVATTMRGAVGIPHDTTLATALDICRKAECDEVVVLSSDYEPAGHFSLEAAGQVPPERLETTALASLTVPIPRGAQVLATLGGRELLEGAREWWGKADVLVVLDEGEVVGVVRLAELSDRLA